MQAEDPDLKDILEWTSQQKQSLEHEVAILSPAAKSWWILKKQLNIVRGVLYHKEESKKVLIAPRKLQKFLLENCHDAPGCGHMGILKTLARPKNYATWHKMGRDVLQYVKGCTTCKTEEWGTKGKSISEELPRRVTNGKSPYRCLRPHHGNSSWKSICTRHGRPMYQMG